MSILQEVNTLTTLRLSETQKIVLCKIIAAPTDELAYEHINDDVNIVAARDQLTDLGMITWSEGTADVTDAGMKVLQDEALADSAGELTELGGQYAYANDANDLPDSGDAPHPNADPNNYAMNKSDPKPPVDRNQLPMNEPIESGAGAEVGAEFASFDLMKTINNAAILND